MIKSLALVGAAAAATSLMSAPASAEPAPAPSRPATEGAVTPELKATYQQPRFKLNGKSRCIDVPRASKKAGTPIQLWDCKKSNNANQQWGFRKRDYGWQIYNRNSKMCLNVPGGTKKAGARIVQWPCASAAPNDRWRLWGFEGRYSAENYASKMFLTVNGSSTKNGAWLIQWPGRNGLDSQEIYMRKP